MGFFQDLKEDLSQAVTELMDDEIQEDSMGETDREALPEDLSMGAADFDIALGLMPEDEADREPPTVLNKDEDFFDFDLDEEELEADIPADLQEEENAAFGYGEEAEVFEAILKAGTEDTAGMEDSTGTEEDVTMDLLYGMDSVAEEETVLDMDEQVLDEIQIEIEEKVEKMEMMENMNEEEKLVGEAVDENAVITKGMKIKGNITSAGSMEIIGMVEGDIDVLGKLNVTGEIRGDSKASEVFADAAKIVGEIQSDGTVKIGASSVIIGNIVATCAVIAGAVKGDIDVQGPVVLDTSAIVMGNIKSKSVQINNGAVIEGMCSQCYAEVNPTNFFEEYK